MKICAVSCECKGNFNIFRIIRVTLNETMWEDKATSTDMKLYFIPTTKETVDLMLQIDGSWMVYA